MWAEILSTLILTSIVSWVSDGITGPVGNFLAWRPLCHLGKISYGVYLYHVPAMFICCRFLQNRGFALSSGPVLLAVVGATSIAVAAISWWALERPLNGYKQLFPYPVPLRRDPSSFLPFAARG